jgi:hypothetical protein
MYQVRIIDFIEIDSVVTIHNNAFPGFFLTLLGNRFLKLYYRSVLRHKDGILLGCYDETEKLSGFCAATISAKGFNTKLVKANFFSFCSVGIYLLFTNANALKHLYLNWSKKDNMQEDTEDYAELLSIGVNSSSQGKGLGKFMLSELEKIVFKKGCKSISLTTDYHDNTKTLKFYKSMGYKVYYEFITYPNREMYRMIKLLK